MSRPGRLMLIAHILRCATSRRANHCASLVFITGSGGLGVCGFCCLDCSNRRPPSAHRRQVHELVEKANVVKEGWNGFNVLHDAASRVAALDLGFLPSASAR